MSVDLIIATILIEGCIYLINYASSIDKPKKVYRKKTRVTFYN